MKLDSHRGVLILVPQAVGLLMRPSFVVVRGGPRLTLLCWSFLSRKSNEGRQKKIPGRASTSMRFLITAES